MKKQTPMTRLKYTLTEIKVILGENFNILELVKKKPTTNYILGIDSPGIKDDYILIFKGVKSKRSFAFTFNYQDKNENILNDSKWKIQVTIKDKEFSPKERSKKNFLEEQKERSKSRNIANRSKIYSKKYSFEEFKFELKKLVKELEKVERLEDEILKVVHFNFRIDDLLKSKSVKKNKIKNFVNDKIKEHKLENIEEDINAKNTQMEIDKQMYESEYKSLDCYVELQEIEKRRVELRDQLSEEKKIILSKYSIQKNKRSISKGLEKIKEVEKQIKDDIKKERPNITKSEQNSVAMMIKDRKKALKPK